MSDLGKYYGRGRCLIYDFTAGRVKHIFATSELAYPSPPPSLLALPGLGLGYYTALKPVAILLAVGCVGMGKQSSDYLFIFSMPGIVLF
jgi:hypothetical protein